MLFCLLAFYAKKNIMIMKTDNINRKSAFIVFNGTGFEEEKMKKLLLIFAIVFGIMGFSGAVYVIYTGGEANAGYGIIPMLFCVICAQGYRSLKK